jgi:Ni/Fe-hydrogenase 1 B-type cytochrome subunit
MARSYSAAFSSIPKSLERLRGDEPASALPRPERLGLVKKYVCALKGFSPAGRSTRRLEPSSRIVQLCSLSRRLAKSTWSSPWRFIWAFYGNRYARWRAILPGCPGYFAALRAYAASFLSGEPQQFVGHNPVARIGVTLLLLLLFVQLATGLVIAGTDLFWPPFGHWFAQWVAAPGVDPAIVQPGAVDVIEKASYEAMRALRGPIVEVHEVTFYALVLLIALHLIAVVLTEIHEGGSITSAMITGRKILTRKPPDAP